MEYVFIMLIQLTKQEIDNVLAKPEFINGVADYLRIQRQIKTNPFRDEKFQKDFASYYSFSERRENYEEWTRQYFNLMEYMSYEKLSFEEALIEFHKRANFYGTSFISKMIATFDTTKPVIDKFVIKNLGLKQEYDKAQRLARTKHDVSGLVSIYEKIEIETQNFLKTEMGQYLVEKIDKLLPHTVGEISPEKKVDFVLWQKR